MDNKIVTLDEMAADINARLKLAANPAQNGGGGGSWEQHKALLTEAAETIARLEAEKAGLINDAARQSVRYVPAQGTTIDEMREHFRATELYRLGDCRLVWVNEGDLYSLPFRAALAQGKGDIANER